MTPVSVPPDPYQRALKDLRLAREELREANERINLLEDALQTAWYLIANVNWDKKDPDLREEFINWRDNDLRLILKTMVERKNKEAKP